MTCRASPEIGTVKTLWEDHATESDILLHASQRATAWRMQLCDVRGWRKYLTQHQRDRFLKAARSVPTPVRTFCEVLAYTGCRLSEALALTPDRVDPGAGVLVFESLKKRRPGVFPAVPVPFWLLENLDSLQLCNAPSCLEAKRWTWSRTTAWRRVREAAHGSRRNRFGPPRYSGDGQRSRPRRCSRLSLRSPSLEFSNAPWRLGLVSRPQNPRYKEPVLRVPTGEVLGPRPDRVTGDPWRFVTGISALHLPSE